MFGFDLLFDFDKNGKLDPSIPAYDSDPYDDTDKDDGGRQR